MRKFTGVTNYCRQFIAPFFQGGVIYKVPFPNLWPYRINKRVRRTKTAKHFGGFPY
jgi:hypothetical protein